MNYYALVTHEEGSALAELPDCPGCQTFVPEGEDIFPAAQEALELWLEGHLLRDEEIPLRVTPPAAPRGTKVLAVPVHLGLAVKVAVRISRKRMGLTQEQLGKSLGVKQQQVAKWEHPDSNLEMKTVERLAEVLHLRSDISPTEPRRKAG